MRTIKVNLYQFDELSDEAKQKAISELADINTDYEWYEDLKNDAQSMGLTIDSFDMYHNTIDGHLHGDMRESIESVLENTWNTSKLNVIAANYDKQLIELEKQPDTADREDNLVDLKIAYTNELLAVYLKLIKSELEYRESEEAIIETIQANEYDFTEDGKLY